MLLGVSYQHDSARQFTPPLVPMWPVLTLKFVMLRSAWSADRLYFMHALHLRVRVILLNRFAKHRAAWVLFRLDLLRLCVHWNLACRNKVAKCIRCRCHRWHLL